MGVKTRNLTLITKHLQTNSSHLERHEKVNDMMNFPLLTVSKKFLRLYHIFDYCKMQCHDNPALHFVSFFAIFEALKQQPPKMDK